MRQPSGVPRVIGEMVSILVLALTGRCIGFAQAMLESGRPLSVERALGFAADILSIYVRLDRLALLLAVVAIAALIRMGIAYTNRSALLVLRERAGLAGQSLSWGERAVRLPIAVVYRGLSGLATLVGGIALAICFRLFDPDHQFGFAELSAYAQAVASGITYASVGALFVLFALYGAALAVIGYIASPAILSLDEMASGCRAPADSSLPGRPAHKR